MKFFTIEYACALNAQFGNICVVDANEEKKKFDAFILGCAGVEMKLRFHCQAWINNATQRNAVGFESCKTICEKSTFKVFQPKPLNAQNTFEIWIMHKIRWW